MMIKTNCTNLFNTSLNKNNITSQLCRCKINFSTLSLFDSMHFFQVERNLPTSLESPMDTSEQTVSSSSALRSDIVTEAATSSEGNSSLVGSTQSSPLPEVTSTSSEANSSEATSSEANSSEATSSEATSSEANSSSVGLTQSSPPSEVTSSLHRATPSSLPSEATSRFERTTESSPWIDSEDFVPVRDKTWKNRYNGTLFKYFL